jgi:putative tryptophan/tyrosine transport system substrate-binding protein
VITRRQLLLVASACVLGATNNRGVQAQTSGKVYRVGILSMGRSTRDIDAFRERLGQLGFVEGRNIRIETRSADRQLDRLPALAMELVRLDVDVIVTITTPAAQAAKAATTTIPIVMAGSASPVALGLVASMARPGGNVTGVTNSPGSGFVPKQLQLLKEAAPKVSRIAIVMTSFAVERSSFEEIQAAGPTLGVMPVPVIVDNPTQPDVAALLTQSRADALYVFPNSINIAHAKTISNFAATNRLPTMYGEREAVEAGGLMSYWVNWLELRRHTADYVDKILKGAKAADLPVEDPTKFELVINLKTAKALGLAIPPSLLLRADEVIQ